MLAKLVVVEPAIEPSEYKVSLPTTIGRSREAKLKLVQALVSRRHCEIYEEDGQVMVRDLGSLNGTFVAGERVDAAPLPSGELLTIGSVTFRAIYGDDVELMPPPINLGTDTAAMDETIDAANARRAESDAVGVIDSAEPWKTDDAEPWTMDDGTPQAAVEDLDDFQIETASSGDEAAEAEAVADLGESPAAETELADEPLDMGDDLTLDSTAEADEQTLNFAPADEHSEETAPAAESTGDELNLDWLKAPASEPAAKEPAADEAGNDEGFNDFLKGLK